ncbi:MAG: tetratricopeptide repeat protein [Sphaerochaetaceae bacterium]|nr:tetratricopeptide repeat protein [Spirochaetales bacterium]MDY5498889.1 tetratricopeptide repeat protein [Sphaerochaetaceae bacterium]
MASTTNWKIGTAINYQKAAEYYQLAADRGDITVNCLLGSLYERGLGVPQDYAKAEELYTISAERGDLIASGGWASLGNLYETRMDGARDYDVARIWYQKAADVGNPDGVSGLLRLGHYNMHPWALGRNLSLTVLFSISDLLSDPAYQEAMDLENTKVGLYGQALLAWAKGDGISPCSRGR